MNRHIQANTFQKGIMLDASDMIMPNDTIRFGQNVRLVNRSGSSYVLSNLQGTESSFSLTTGFEPVAAQEFAGVLYIISWNSTTEELELGSYPSPNYSNPTNPSIDVNVYRPLNNFNGGAFRTDKFDTPSKPVIQKLEIQPDFDESVNMVFTITGKRPRIVNTKFQATNNGTTFSILPDRNIESGAASSNKYDTDSVNKETSLILFSQKIMKINFGGIQPGGKLKCGNYQYVFYYMTEDFNRTAVVGQSSTCQISFGDTISSIRGGDETQETNRRVFLSLSNLDTDFRYVKVYFLYSSGQDGVQDQYLELVQPIEITGESFSFYHTGFEEVTEVSKSEVDIDYAAIDSAAASTQLAGYYFLGDISQRSINFTTFRSKIEQVRASYAEKLLSAGSLGLPGYADPLNVYNYMGYMGRETYPFGVVLVMNDGSLSPVFPIRGVDFVTAAVNGSVGENYVPLNTEQERKNNLGLVTFPFSNHRLIYDSVNEQLKVKHLKINLRSLAIDNEILSETIGFFIVRGERRQNAITQGILIPTIKAPTIEAPDNGFGTQTNSWSKAGPGGYYLKNGASIDNINVFKHLINLDSIFEAFFLNVEGSGDKNVIDEDGSILNGYMPTWMFEHTTINYDKRETVPAPQKLWYSKSDETAGARHWALLSGDAIVNEPEFITALQRENMGIHQLAKPLFKVKGEVQPLYGSSSIFGFLGGLFEGLLVEAPSDVDFGAYYDMVSYGLLDSNVYVGTSIKKIKKTVFVPGESLATGVDFVSKLKVALFQGLSKGSGNELTNSKHFWVNQWYNSYFGIEIDKLDGNYLQDSTVGSTNPIGGNLRPGKKTLNVNEADSGGPTYSNLGEDVPAAFLVNIYPQDRILAPSELYPSIDNIVYHQVSPRFFWDDTELVNNDYRVDVFGGDCYIAKVNRKLNQCPERNASTLQTDRGKRWNIDSGLIIGWWQESKYNLHLRQPKQFDASELERRSFFPYQSLGDPIAYRKYRLPETTAHSPGYSVLAPPKAFYGVSPTIPFERTRFMNRIYHSEKHIPNAFRNGYRSFLETNFRDYDAGMGSIVGLFNHRGMLLVVFEHGLGITAVEQRVETGRDAAGAVFIEPTSVLPPTLTYLSKEIGCQDTLSLVQTPGAVYGIDRAKDKIWRVADGLKVISDESVSSWLIDNPANNPRSGYDFENNEVIFNTDNWCLCFTEGLDKFTSFYTFTSAEFFARRNKELYSFISNNAHRHNSESVFTIYGFAQEVIAEIVINKDLSVAKVIDYLNLISNEVPPSKVELYSYNQDVTVSPVIQVAGLNQYTKVEFGVDALTAEPTMLYRDKKYVIQVPYRQDYNTGSDADEWGIEGRMRDKYLIVRLTYVTDKPLELASVLNFYRYSPS